MAHNDAVTFLKNYDCVCPYGTHPNATCCREQGCDFYIAVNSLKPEVSEGKWEETPYFDYKCSLCNTRYATAYKFCPNCGAKMISKKRG